jgi:hypothetical protein
MKISVEPHQTKYIIDAELLLTYYICIFLYSYLALALSDSTMLYLLCISKLEKYIEGSVPKEEKKILFAVCWTKIMFNNCFVWTG